MAPLRLSAVLAYITAAAAGQIPLHQSSATPQVIGATGTGGLIDTETLQADIEIKNLLYRAKQFSKIADLGIDEYNHPTRVIGSKGVYGSRSSR